MIAQSTAMYRREEEEEEEGGWNKREGVPPWLLSYHPDHRHPG